MFRILKILFVIFVLAGAASGMATEAVKSYVTNASGLAGIPYGYTPTKNIEYMLQKADLPVPEFENEYAILWREQSIYLVSNTKEDTKCKTEFGDIITPTPVAWYGSSSVFRLYYNNSLHDNAVVVHGMNLSTVEYDPLGKVPIKYLYEEPIFKFNITSELPVS